MRSQPVALILVAVLISLTLLITACGDQALGTVPAITPAPTTAISTTVRTLTPKPGTPAPVSSDLTIFLNGGKDLPADYQAELTDTILRDMDSVKPADFKIIIKAYPMDPLDLSKTLNLLIRNEGYHPAITPDPLKRGSDNTYQGIYFKKNNPAYWFTVSDAVPKSLSTPASTLPAGVKSILQVVSGTGLFITTETPPPGSLPPDHPLWVLVNGIELPADSLDNSVQEMIDLFHSSRPPDFEAYVYAYTQEPAEIANALHKLLTDAGYKNSPALPLLKPDADGVYMGYFFREGASDLFVCLGSSGNHLFNELNGQIPASAKTIVLTLSGTNLFGSLTGLKPSVTTK